MKRSLVSALKRIWPAAGLTAVLLIAAACRGEDARDAGATLTPIVTATAALGSDEGLNPASEIGDSLVPFYKSLYDLVRTNETIVVGRVTGTLLPCNQSRGFTVYSVEIEQVIASESLRPEDTIGFRWDGWGICEDTPPEVAAAYDPKAAYETERDPMVEIGSTYLFFLNPMRRGLKYYFGIPEPWGTTYAGPSFGRFLIGADGRLQIVSKFWTCAECAAPKALAGKTVAEAETTLRPVIAQVALESTSTPTPTPTPSPQSGTP